MLPRRRRKAERDFASAQLAVQEFGGWVRHADSKITVLAAAIGVSVTLLAARGGAVFAVLAETNLRPWIQLAIILTGVGSLVCIGAALRLVFLSLTPRLTASAPGNPFSWPDVAVSPPRVRLSHERHVEFAWQETEILASIALMKFVAFRRSLEWFLVSIVLSVTCVLLTDSALAWSLAEVAR